MSTNSSNQSDHAALQGAVPLAAQAIQPTVGWMLRSPARVLAFGLGSGLIRPAPGTWGTLLGWLLWVLVLSRLPSAGVAVALVVCFLYGCLICQRVGRDLGRPDHGGMVWDEMVAIWLNDRDETTLKYFYAENGRIRLQPANPFMQAIIINDPKTVEVQGKVVLVIRQLDQ